MQQLNEMKYLDNNNFNLKDDLNNSHIYQIINKINGKMYIGQASCFIGSNNNRWGTIGRWKSHVSEAIKNIDDHCVLLNNAIRKYGPENFDIKTVFKGNFSEINEKEVYYIQLFNSLTPNGYNLKTGGDKGKDSDDTKKKKSDAHIGTKHTEKTKENISKGQIGNRRNSMKRKYEEDNSLPKYICTIRNNKIITGYSIKYFPIGIDKPEYLPQKIFSISKYGSKELALKTAIEHLDEIKKKYHYIEENIKTIKEKDNIVLSNEKKEKNVKEKLPEYIYPIIEECKIKGYYVEGIVNKYGNFFKRRNFIDNTNRWNLDQANKFVDILKYINDNDVDISSIDFDELDINDVKKSFYEKYYLPKYFNILRKKGDICGFCINGFPNDKYKDGKYKKEFTLKGRTLDEVYEEGIAFLNDLKLN
jgi:group I intron endonuclease